MPKYFPYEGNWYRPLRDTTGATPQTGRNLPVSTSLTVAGDHRGVDHREAIVELIDIELSEFTRRSRSVVLTHSASGLGRGLEYGERVLLHTGGEEYRTAVVADIDFTLDDTQYRLILGGQVPAALAVERAGATAPSVSGRVSVHDVADMLARSGAGRRIPMQRQAAQRLLFER